MEARAQIPGSEVTMAQEAMETAPSNPMEDETFREAFKAVIARLELRAQLYVGRRSSLEQRWLEDLRRYHGRNGVEEEQRLKEMNAKGEGRRSQAVINVTRPKANAMAARLMDMLFPTDEKCWGIDPTPDPELEKGAKEAAEQLRDATRKVAAMDEAERDGRAIDPAQMQEAQTALQQISEAANDLKARQKIAKEKCEAMERRIDDQLEESRFAAHARDMIDDACRLGCGIMEGPVVNDRIRRGWKESQEGGFALEYAADTQPGVRRIDPWAFFPDPNARVVEEAEGFFVRELYTRRRMRLLKNLPGVDEDALRRLVSSKPREQVPSFLQELRTITDTNQTVEEDRYVVWRYIGALDYEDIMTLAVGMDDQELAELVGDIDPLTELNVVILFCDGEVLRIDPHPLDSQEPLFSVFSLEKDEASILGGYGIPYIIRNEQRIMNSAWRAMMDNAAVAAGPQVVVDKRATPENGQPALHPWKVWNYDGDDPNQSGKVPVHLIQPDMNQQQLANIIVMARQQIDDVASLPSIQQGEQTEQQTKTVGGMALLMSSGNVIFRRVVRQWDDDVTVPLIRRKYDFNMQHAEDDSIKGDYQVAARGSSVLLVRELQAQNLMWVMANFGDDPEIDSSEVKRTFFRALLLRSDDFLRTQEQRDQWLKEQREIQGPTAEEVKMKEVEAKFADTEARLAVAEMDRDTRLEVAALTHESVMMKLAESMNLDENKLNAMLMQSREQIQATLQNSREDRESKERILAAEIGDKRQTGEGAGGMV